MGVKIVTKNTDPIGHGVFYVGITPVAHLAVSGYYELIIHTKKYMGVEGGNRRPNRIQMRQDANRMHGGRSAEEIDKANAAQNTLPEKTLINGRRLNRTQMREETDRMIAARTVEQNTASEAPAAAETPADEDGLEAAQ